MEARMARVEAMLEALLQERAMYIMSSVSADRDNSVGNMSVPMAMSEPMSISDHINPVLSFMHHSPQGMPPHDAIDPLLDADTASVRLGSQSFNFPTPPAYQNYIDTFFRQLQVYSPCIDERLFRARSAKMLLGAEIYPQDVCFLALNYIILALLDAHAKVARPSLGDKHPGWHWLDLADDVVGKRQLYGSGDTSLAQFLVLKVCLMALISNKY